MTASIIAVYSCAGATPPPEEATPVAPAAETAGDIAPAGSGTSLTPMEVSGASFENPMKLCGPEASYAAVARTACEDGSTPLRGDPDAAQAARQYSSRAHIEADPNDVMNSHIVDVYELPCPGGNTLVFVCMYHCPDGRSPLAR